MFGVERVQVGVSRIHGVRLWAGPCIVPYVARPMANTDVSEHAVRARIDPCGALVRQSGGASPERLRRAVA